LADELFGRLVPEFRHRAVDHRVVALAVLHVKFLRHGVEDGLQQPAGGVPLALQVFKFRQVRDGDDDEIVGLSCRQQELADSPWSADRQLPPVRHTLRCREHPRLKHGGLGDAGQAFAHRLADERRFREAQTLGCGEVRIGADKIPNVARRSGHRPQHH
jgi:hypothetical protein